jgi:nicotinamide riboside transporter PnuC
MSVHFLSKAAFNAEMVILYTEFPISLFGWFGWTYLDNGPQGDWRV